MEMLYVFTRNNSLRIIWGSVPAREPKAANWETWRPLARRASR